ncbi:RNA-directed DNA polymerase from mobile element jockey [Trichonephila clavipes]|nr:RNA-directed DNA polymerase from mobile element jockey [Trichonephila clavipes]
MDESQISCATLRALAINSREQLIREQRKDPELGHIYRYSENPDDGSVNATICEGADRTSLLRLYRALIRSKLDYGSVVYSSACKSLLKILDPVHHQALRLCLRAFRTSPVESLYAEAYEPPLDLRRNLYDFNSHHSSLTYSQPFHFRIRDLINDLNLNIGRIALCKISEVSPWKVIYPKVDFTLSYYSKACTPESTYRTLYLEHRELFSDYEPIFTDGSKSESLVDSLSALQSIVSLHSSSHPILVGITYALANHLKKDIRFCWIPGHAGITGNELADTAARSATGFSERFPIPHSDLKACFRLKLQSVWQSNWDQQTENKLHSIMPVLAPTVPSLSNHREQVVWTRLRLGHTRLTHRHLLLGEPPPYCEKCNVSLSRSSDRSSRSQPGKFKGSRKTSSEQCNGHKSSKSNAGWEDPRLKRKVESNGSGDRKNLKKSKICRKRSLQGSEHRNKKRPTPERKQGIKRAVPSSVSSRNYKYRRPNNPSQGSQSIAGPSHQQDSRQDKSTTVASRQEVSGQYNKARETKSTKNGNNRAAERRTVRSKQTTAVRPCLYYLRSRVRQPEGFPEEREEQQNRKYSTKQHQEKEPQYGSLRRRSSG